MENQKLKWKPDRAFGPYLEFAMPEGAEIIVLCVDHPNSGHMPIEVILPHQVRFEKAARILSEHPGCKSFTIMPVRCSEKITFTLNEPQS